MNILIADDEKDFVHFLKANLISKGYSVDAVMDGEKALELIKVKKYDLMLLDINMPELTGLELAKYVRENGIETKVVIVTGYEEMDEQFAKAFGPCEYLKKPISMEDIERIIKSRGCKEGP